MRRSITILLGIMLIGAVWGIGIEVFRKDQEEYDLLMNAFRETGFRYEEARIKVSGVLNNGTFNEDNLHIQIKEIIQNHGFNGNWKVEGEKKQNNQRMQSTFNNEDFIFTITTIISGENGDWNTYLHTEIVINKEDVIVGELMGAINEIFNLFDIKGAIRMTIQGVSDGVLDTVQIKEKGENILKKLKAKEEEVYTNNYAYSIYGYTKKISNYYVNPLNKKKMNINVIFRYEERYDTTVLYIVTPLMDEAY